MKAAVLLYFSLTVYRLRWRIKRSPLDARCVCLVYLSIYPSVCVCCQLFFECNSTLLDCLYTYENNLWCSYYREMGVISAGIYDSHRLDDLIGPSYWLERGTARRVMITMQSKAQSTSRFDFISYVQYSTCTMCWWHLAGALGPTRPSALYIR